MLEEVGVSRSMQDDDMRDLAKHARTVLAGGRHALVTLHRESNRGWVGLLDDAGEPILLAGAGSPPADAARSALRGRVDVPGAGGERLVLTGTLRPLPATLETIIRRLSGVARTVVIPDTHDGCIHPIALAVDEVHLCLPASGSASGGLRTAGPAGSDRAVRWASPSEGRRVDLDAYALADPDLVAAYAPELIGHLNAEHGDQLRQLATLGLAAGGPARRETTSATSTTSTDLAHPVHGTHRPGGGACPDDVAGAQVTHLDRGGMVLWRVGADGADEVHIAFREPLTEPRALGLELRWLLSQSAGRPE